MKFEQIKNYSPDLSYINKRGEILKEGVIYDSHLEEWFRTPTNSDFTGEWTLLVEDSSDNDNDNDDYDIDLWI